MSFGIPSMEVLGFMCLICFDRKVSMGGMMKFYVIHELPYLYGGVVDVGDGNGWDYWHEK